jgi:hypothetical protein
MSILILSYLCLGLLSGFPTKILYAFLISMCATWSIHLVLDFIIVIFGEEYKVCSLSVYSYVTLSVLPPYILLSTLKLWSCIHVTDQSHTSKT